MTGTSPPGLEAHFHDGEERGLRVQGVENGLDHEEIDTARDQGAGLLAVCRPEFLEGDLPGPRVVHVGRDRGRAVHRTQDPGHEAGALRCANRVLVGGFARDPRGCEVDLGHRVLDPVVGHRQPRGAEGVGLDDVGARGQVGAVNLADHIGTGQRKEVVVAEERGGVGREEVAPEVRFAQAVRLDHGPHCAIEDQDALGGQPSDLPKAIRAGGHCPGVRAGRAVRLRAVYRALPASRVRRSHWCHASSAGAPAVRDPALPVPTGREVTRRVARRPCTGGRERPASLRVAF